MALRVSTIIVAVEDGRTHPKCKWVRGKRDVMVKIRVVCFEGGGRGYEPKNTGSL